MPISAPSCGRCTRCRFALRQARTRFGDGDIPYLQVLDTQRSALAMEQQLVESTTTISINPVLIYKALGGDWEDSFPAASASAPASN
ncbi:TolC family protein [Rhodovastum atsumiense]|uniref:TolC family protein n=1 Tax=Rhodovastum atsumiense TaxID=504468 RepID=A0A5M6IY39_9PROT|nr:TolC family protein [Rhodovastum atsumiense]KAA5612737.1 TolC family protein [Rhodovastum atsumiense]CAH2602705.1 TolC family protein [Rhodovastum atsumiense]